jgi:hypothetical protein
MEALKPIRTEIQSILSAGAFTYKDVNNGYIRELVTLGVLPALDLELEQTRVIYDGNWKRYEISGIARIVVHDWKRTDAVDSFESAVVDIINVMEDYNGSTFRDFRGIRSASGSGQMGNGDSIRIAGIYFTCRIG